MTAFDRTVARVNEIADRDCPDREKVGDYLVAILDTQIAELIRSGSLRESGYTEIADLLDAMADALRAEADELEQHGGMVSAHWVAMNLRFMADHGRRWPQPGEGPHITTTTAPR